MLTSQLFEKSFRNKSKKWMHYDILLSQNSKLYPKYLSRDKRVDPQFENYNIYHFAPYNYLSERKKKFWHTFLIHSFTHWLLIEIELTFATHNSASVCRLLLSPSIRTSQSMKFMTNDFVWIMSWCGIGVEMLKNCFILETIFFRERDNNILWYVIIVENF